MVSKLLNYCTYVVLVLCICGVSLKFVCVHPLDQSIKSICWDFICPYDF